MARSYAQFSTSMWRDADFVALPVTVKSIYMLLSSQPDISAAGVLHLSVTRWAGMSPDTTADDINQILDYLAARRFVVIDRSTEEVLLRSFLRWDNGYKNPKRIHAIRDAADGVLSPAIVAALAVEFERLQVPAQYRGQCSASPKHDPEPPPVLTPTETTFSQVEGLSKALPENADRASIEERRVPQPTTHNKQPATPEDQNQEAADADSLFNIELASVRPSTDDWRARNSQPRTEGDRVPRQTVPPEVFAAMRRAEIEKLPQAAQIIGGWLQSHGFPNVSAKDVGAVHRAVIERYPDKKITIDYLRGIAARGGFASFYQPIIEARADEITKQVRRLTDGQPDCGHGYPGGNLAHPTTGAAICPLCRAGAPVATRRLGETTHPDVRAALDAYRSAYRASFGALPLLPLLMSVTGEAETLRQHGVPVDQLADIASRAGALGALLLETARSLKGQPT